MSGIQLTGVTKTYQVGDEAFRALDGVTISIEDGDFVALMGPSGSGKSTLANIIGGLDRPDQGQVVVDGQDLSRLNDGDLSRFRNQKIGFVFQAFNLKSDSTALENVMLPMVLAGQKKGERKARAQECLGQLGLGSKGDRLPRQLSGGERQRIAIARALAMRPSVIIADEPTGNLDTSRGQEVVEILGHLNESGITLLVITHDPGVARHARRNVEIRDGHLREAVT